MPSMTASVNGVVEALQPYTTCDVSDALCKLGYRNGGFLPNITMWSPKRQEGDAKVVGPAYTVKYVSEDDPKPKVSTHYIDSLLEGCVIFISCPLGVPNAVYGGLMSTRARASGAVGTVVDGRFRDLHEQRALDYPVFARDIGTAPPYGCVKVSEVNTPVKLHSSEVDVTISPGDYIVADVNGVVVLPERLLQDVLPLMEKQVAADTLVAEALTKGSTFTEASKKHRA